MHDILKRLCLSGSMTALFAAAPFLAGQSMAQEAVTPATESVVVTGTHIANGNLQPTPVTVESTEQLQATTPESIPAALMKLPIFQESGTSNNTVTGANGRGYNQAGNYMNLRALGAIRTLVLMDGHRVPGTFYDTTVNTDMLPQMLMQRVEVVTGGASAVYGSDAVTGVVNFILDRKFDGLKGVFQGGISDYGDRKSYRLGLAGGTDLGSHGHLIWSLEYMNQDAIPDASSRPFGGVSAADVGSTFNGSAGSQTNPYILVKGVRANNHNPYGLIESNAGAAVAGGTSLSQYGPYNNPANIALQGDKPLTGIARYMFSPDGKSITPFDPGALTYTSNISVGGDGGWGHNEYLVPVNNTYQGFAHYDWDFGGNTVGYVEGRYAHGRTYAASQGINENTTAYPITIYSGNGFLTPTEQSQLFPAGGPSSFTMAKTENGLMSRLGLHQNTSAYGFSAGLSGTTFGDFAWDSYFTYGDTRTSIVTTGNLNTDRFYAAVDAVKDPSNGNMVCASSLYATGAFPGCVPINLFGGSATTNGLGNISQAAYQYVTGTTWNNAHNTMADFGVNLNGTAFQGWAGPIKVAVGAEYRLQSLNVTTSTSDNTFNPQYLRLGALSTWGGPGCPGGAGAGPYPVYAAGAQCAPTTSSYPGSNLAWVKEVQSGATGSENIEEANFEIDAPLLKDLPGIQMLSVNAAYRYAQYSAAGNGVSHSQFSANTWKLGAEWQVYDDLKLRATRSRDIRAPTLWDLFQQQVVTSSGVFDPLTNIAQSLNTLAGGNPSLVPEKFNNTTAGVVFTPSWLEGFSASFDYFHIYSNNAIGTISGNTAQFITNCAASNGAQSYCALLVRPLGYQNTTPGNYPSLNISLNQNVALLAAEGADIELNYQTDLREWSGLDGIANFRVLWTHYPTYKTQGSPVVTPVDNAGTASGAPTAGIPADKVAVTFDYSLRGFTFDLLEKFDSSVTQTNTPGQYYNIPNEPAYYQTDINLSYDFQTDDLPVTAFLNVANLFNAHGGILQSPGYTSSVGMNYPVSPWVDVIGRYYTTGIRFKM
jgi:outer membrane receptor protein involved in Fe transport